MIDFHTHIVPPAVKQNREFYAARDSSFAALYADPKAKLATAEELIVAMDKNGIDVSVVLNYGWVTLALSREVNDYLLYAAAKYQGRLVAFCNAPLTSKSGLKEIERCLSAGARGVGEIRPDLLPAKDRIKLLQPVAELLKKYDGILLTHASEPVGHVYPGKGAATPDILIQIIMAFPDLKIVCAHWGGGLPFYTLMPEVKALLKNVYFDTAASPFLYKPEIYRRVIDLVGVEKVLFGSDYPLLDAGRYFKEIEGLRLAAQTKTKILGENGGVLIEKI